MRKVLIGVMCLFLMSVGGPGIVGCYAETTVVVKVDGVEVFTVILPDDASVVVVEKTVNTTVTTPINP